MLFHFSQTPEGQWQGTLDSLDQGAVGIPIDRITVEGGSVHCEINAIKGSYEGTLAADGQSIGGTWTQVGRPLPLTLRPATPQAPAPPKRPQEPVPPYPYSGEDVAFINPAAPVELAGTLTRPGGDGPFPAVLLIAGSGAQNRNEEVAGHKVFLVLADALTRRGLAVLRLDKRGIGLSKGDYAHATTEDFISDALAGVSYLRHGADIQPQHIGLLGHSEGAVIAPAVAVASPDVAFLVLVGAPAVPGDQILLRQGELIRATDASHSAAFRAFSTGLQRQLIEAVEQQADNAHAADAMRAIWAAQEKKLPASGLSAVEQQEIRQAGRRQDQEILQMTSPWMRHFLTYDPAPVLRKVRQPILVLYGSLDLQVPPSQNRAPMEQLLKADQDHTVTGLPGINHIMQPAKTGSPAEYAKIGTTIDPQVLKVIGDWVALHAGPSGRQ